MNAPALTITSLTESGSGLLRATCHTTDRRPFAATAILLPCGTITVLTRHYDDSTDLDAIETAIAAALCRRECAQ